MEDAVSFLRTSEPHVDAFSKGPGFPDRFGENISYSHFPGVVVHGEVFHNAKEGQAAAPPERGRVVGTPSAAILSSANALDAQKLSLLKDGTRPTTLADARKLNVALPDLHGRNPAWHLAGDLLLAASGGDETAFDRVGIQLRIALKAEGLIYRVEPGLLGKESA
jgi:hypothetical protein